jgi:hypothetical protein
MAYILGIPSPGPAVGTQGARKPLSRRPIGSGQPAGLTPEQDLESRRAGLDARFLQGYNQNEGLKVPFNDTVKGGLYAQAADSAAGQNASSQESIRRNFAARGMGMSGGALAAQLQEQRRSGQALQKARAQINTTSELENFSAQERALDRLLRALSMEVNYQAQFENTAEDKLSAAISKLSGDNQQPFGSVGAIGGDAGAAPADGLLGYSGGALPDSPAQGPEDVWQRPGTSPGWRPAGSTPAGQAYNAGSYVPEGFLGGGAGAGFGGVPTQYGGVPVGGLWALPSGSGNPAYAGAGGNFNGMTGTPEDILSQQRLAGPTLAQPSRTPAGFVRPGRQVSDTPVYGPGVPQTWGSKAGSGVTLSKATGGAAKKSSAKAPGATSPAERRKFLEKYARR